MLARRVHLPHNPAVPIRVALWANSDSSDVSRTAECESVAGENAVRGRSMPAIEGLLVVACFLLLPWGGPCERVSRPAEIRFSGALPSASLVARVRCDDLRDAASLIAPNIDREICEDDDDTDAGGASNFDEDHRTGLVRSNRPIAVTVMPEGSRERGCGMILRC